MQRNLRDMGQERILRVIPTWDTYVQKVAEKKGLKKIGEGGYRNLPLLRKFFWSESIHERNGKTICIDLP